MEYNKELEKSDYEKAMEEEELKYMESKENDDNKKKEFSDLDIFNSTNYYNKTKVFL